MTVNIKIFVLEVMLLQTMMLTAGSSQNLIVTTDNMNYAILERQEAAAAGSQGNIISAREHIADALQFDPDQLESIFMKKILDDFDAGLSTKSMVMMIFSGIEQIYFQNPEKSAQSVSALQSGAENNFAVRLVLGRLSALSGNTDDALQQYDMGISIQPGFPLTYLWRADLMREQGNLEGALRDLETCIKLVPANYQANFALGSVWLAKDKCNEAVACFEKTLMIAPGYAYFLQPNLEICAAYNGRGLLALNGGDFSGALSDFTRAIQLNPRFGEFYLNRGITYRHMGSINAAIRDFDRAVLLDRKYIEAYFNRGLLFLQMKYYTQALKDLERVLALDKFHIGARYQIGAIYLATQEYMYAVSAFDSLLVYRPDHYRAIYSKALALDELKHYRQAAQAYETFFDLGPDSLYEHKLKAWERARLIRRVLHEKYGD